MRPLVHSRANSACASGTSGDRLCHFSPPQPKSVVVCRLSFLKAFERAPFLALVSPAFRPTNNIKVAKADWQVPAGRAGYAFPFPLRNGAESGGHRVPGGRCDVKKIRLGCPSRTKIIASMNR